MVYRIQDNAGEYYYDWSKFVSSGDDVDLVIAGYSLCKYLYRYFPSSPVHKRVCMYFCTGLVKAVVL